MERPYAVEMLGITKRFPGVHALDDVSFRVRQGEVHALLGENGAGKSTLIKVLGGIYQKDEGEIRLNGRKVEIAGPAGARRLGISLIHQELNLVPYFNVPQNIFVGREKDAAKGLFLDPGKMAELAKQSLSALGVKLPLNVPVKKLAASQQQMVAIARALSEEASILVMDEPTAMLSDREIKQLFAIIDRLKRNGVTVIYISHRLEEILGITDSLTILKDGRLVRSCPTKGTTLEEIVESMVGRSLTQQFPARDVALGGELLSVEGLSDGILVEDVSFRLHAGEVLGIVGAVGAGKSELVRTIFGARQRTKGEIRVCGTRVAVRSPRDAIKAGLALAPEDRRHHALIVQDDIQSNIVLPFLGRLSKLGFVRRPQARREARTLAERFRVMMTGLDQKVLYLSGGNQQKVALSKWFGTRAKVFMLDEPTHGIDVGAKHEVYRFINQLVADQAGVIFVSSDVPEIIGVADRILVIREGRVVAESAKGEATPKAILTAMIG